MQNIVINVLPRLFHKNLNWGYKSWLTPGLERFGHEDLKSTRMQNKNHHYLCEFKGESLLHIGIVTPNGANSEWWNHSWELIFVLAGISSD